MPVVGVPLLECICWDHDRFGKDYLGEFDIALEDIFSEGQINQEVSGSTIDVGFPLTSSPAHMVHAQLKTGIPSLESEKEEGQHGLGGNSFAVLTRGLREPDCYTRGHLSEIQDPGIRG